MQIRWAVLLLVVLLGAGVALLGRNERGGASGGAGERSDAERSAPPLAGEGTAPRSTPGPGPTLTGEGADGSRRPADGASTTELGPRTPGAAAVVARYAGEVPAGWHEAPPAQRPHAIRPPQPPGPAAGPSGSSGGVGPTGHWTRFPPPRPATGDATLQVVVKDSTGSGVAGADVYLGPRESLRAEAVSFGDLRRIGGTGSDGALTASDLPAGAATLAANLANQLNGPRGLDARSSIPVLLLSRASVHATVSLPLDTGSFGAVSGRVVDARQQPVARADVEFGFLRTRTDAAGRFAVPHLPAGPQSLTVRRHGYAAGDEEVDVPRGGTREVEIVLAWAESGDLQLAGRVLTEAGAGLPGAAIYLMSGAGRGTLRSTISGANGAYRFDDLADRLASTPLEVQADKHREGYAAATVHLLEGLPDAALDLRLPPRQVKVRFLLTDAGTGKPVDRCRIEARRLDEVGASAGEFGSSRADGVFAHWYPAGRYRFGVEAPDRETQVLEVDLTPPGGAVDLPVAFPSAREPSVQVTIHVYVLNAVTDAPVTECSVVFFDAQGVEAARFVGRAPDGRYALPVPSGFGVLQVSAAGLETTAEDIEVSATTPEQQFVSYLAPR